MPERSTAATTAHQARVDVGDAPPPEIEEFIRFCHHRRAADWPELYDEMCAVAARGEFNGWGHEQFADHGLTFALSGMPRLASWVRTTLAARVETVELGAGATPGH
jgi:hypothetical protein